MSENVDIPVTTDVETAEKILDDLENGSPVTLEVDASENLIDQIRWQLENDRPVTKLVDDYTRGEDDG